MGEAKRRKRLPCICGSGDPAGECCWTSHGYHKKSVVVDLRNTGLAGKHDRCYLAAMGTCDTKISGEHLISHGVLKILAEKQVELCGLPWQKPGDKKMLSFNTLIGLRRSRRSGGMVGLLSRAPNRTANDLCHHATYD
jgi:hypothetical protein